MEKIIYSVQTVQAEGTSHPYGRKRDMEEIVGGDGRNKYGDKNMITYEDFISAICCMCLKEKCDAHGSRKCFLNERISILYFCFLYFHM